MSVPALIPQGPAPAYRANPVRIACVQYDVKVGGLVVPADMQKGQVTENAAKVVSMTSRWGGLRCI